MKVRVLIVLVISALCVSSVRAAALEFDPNIGSAYRTHRESRNRIVELIQLREYLDEVESQARGGTQDAFNRLRHKISNVHRTIDKSFKDPDEIDYIGLEDTSVNQEYYDLFVAAYFSWPFLRRMQTEDTRPSADAFLRRIGHTIEGQGQDPTSIGRRYGWLPNGQHTGKFPSTLVTTITDQIQWMLLRLRTDPDLSPREDLERGPLAEKHREAHRVAVNISVGAQGYGAREAVDLLNRLRSQEDPILWAVRGPDGRIPGITKPSTWNSDSDFEDHMKALGELLEYFEKGLVAIGMDPKR